MSEAPTPDQQPDPAFTTRPEQPRGFVVLLREVGLFVATWFKVNKWVGWASLLIAVIPDWQGRFTYWRDTLRSVGGHANMLGDVLPYVPPVLTCLGVIYIIVILWQEELGRERKWMPLAGWTILTSFIATFGALGLFVDFIKTSKIPAAIAYLALQSEDRFILQEQADRFKTEIVKVKDQIPPFPVASARNPEALQYSSDLLYIFKDAGLKVILNGKEQTNPEPVDVYSTKQKGIEILVRFADAPSRSAVLFAYASKAAGFSTKYVSADWVEADTFVVLICPQ